MGAYWFIKKLIIWIVLLEHNLISNTYKQGAYGNRLQSICGLRLERRRRGAFLWILLISDQPVVKHSVVEVIHQWDRLHLHCSVLVTGKIRQNCNAISVDGTIRFIQRVSICDVRKEECTIGTDSEWLTHEGYSCFRLGITSGGVIDMFTKRGKILTVACAIQAFEGSVLSRAQYLINYWCH